MRRQQIDLEQLEDAMNMASEGVKFARKCVQRAARMQKANARRKPKCRAKARRRRSSSAPERIGPAPGYVPDEMPPVGEKWVHIGDGKFVTMRLYKQQLKAQRRQEQRVANADWNS